MRWNVVELAENGRYAKLHRGFLVVMQGEQELGQVIIDEMNCLLLTAEQSSLSKPLMVRLAEHGIPIVVCGKNYHPISITLPYSAHHQSTRILQLQISASTPLRKRLWQSLVKTKIDHQRQALQWCHPEKTRALRQLDRLSKKVRSGDPDNLEAQASRVYWQSLMGTDFRRQHDGNDSINTALNYGYTIMRAGCARAIVAAGLLPAIGVHHSNQGNAFCLADDLMEVYRPLVDFTVFNLESQKELSSETKRKLARLLQTDILFNEKNTTVSTSMQAIAFSLAKSYENGKMELQLPQLIRSRES